MSKSSAVTPPQPQDWQHRTGAPGYFVTKDGRFQMLMTHNGHFAICTTAKSKQGFRIIRGPAADPEDLGIPATLLEEADQLTVEHIITQAKKARSESEHRQQSPARKS